MNLFYWYDKKENCFNEEEKGTPYVNWEIMGAFLKETQLLPALYIALGKTVGFNRGSFTGYQRKPRLMIAYLENLILQIQSEKNNSITLSLRNEDTPIYAYNIPNSVLFADAAKSDVEKINLLAEELTNFLDASLRLIKERS